MCSIKNQVLNMHSSGFITSLCGFCGSCNLLGSVPANSSSGIVTLSAKMSVIKPHLNQKPVISDLCNYVRTNRWYL